MIAARDLLTQHFPTPAWLWLLLGVGLLWFALQLVLMLQFPAIKQKLMPAVVLADFAWVVTSLALWLLYRASISSIGDGLIIGTNAMVATLAWLQYSAWQAQHPHRESTRAGQRLRH